MPLNFPQSSEKNVYLLKLKSYLGRLEGRAHHATLLRSESFVYYFLGFAKHPEQLFFLKRLFRTTPRIIKLGEKSL